MLFLRDHGPDMWDHDSCNLLHHRHDYAISELAIGLGVADWDFESVREAHQSRTFSWSQTPRAILISLPNKNLRPIFIISCRKRASYAMRINHAISKTISGSSMLFSVFLQVIPHFFRQGIARVNDISAMVKVPIPIPWQNGF